MVNFVINFLFGLLPEIIYFTLFLIYTKNYKTNKIKLFLFLLIGYTLFKYLFKVNIYFQICFIIYVPIVLKFLYKDKFHISDIFVFVYASIILMAISFIVLPIDLIFHNYLFAFIINRILIFVILFYLKNKLHKAYSWIIKQWNRNYEKPNKIKSITIRQVCVISLNIMIFILNLGIQCIKSKIGS